MAYVVEMLRSLLTTHSLSAQPDFTANGGYVLFSFVNPKKAFHLVPVISDAMAPFRVSCGSCLPGTRNDKPASDILLAHGGFEDC
jgi:hypothetical protein